MTKVMTLDVLSNIKDAKESDVIASLFDIIKNADIKPENTFDFTEVEPLENLREDVVKKSSKETIDLIKRNFPKIKDNYLVVSKVIEE